jgi:hypothetical protein
MADGETRRRNHSLHSSLGPLNPKLEWRNRSGSLQSYTFDPTPPNSRDFAALIAVARALNIS